MDDQPLQSEADYERALKEIEALWNAPLGTPASARLNQLIRLVDDYESVHHPIGKVEQRPVQQVEGAFRPSTERLEALARRGAALLDSATDDELGLFSEVSPGGHCHLKDDD